METWEKLTELHSFFTSVFTQEVGNISIRKKYIPVIVLENVQNGLPAGGGGVCVSSIDLLYV